MKFGDGAFIVRYRHHPGTYRSSASGDCYWQRERNWTGGIGGIIANGIGTSHPVVSISVSDTGFSSTSCGTWTVLQLAPRNCESVKEVGSSRPPCLMQDGRTPGGMQVGIRARSAAGG